jgi:hypothetical protein
MGTRIIMKLGDKVKVINTNKVSSIKRMDEFVGMTGYISMIDNISSKENTFIEVIIKHI